MVARYRRDATTAEGLKLGWLKPMHEVIPELAKSVQDSSVGGESSVQSSVSSWFPLRGNGTPPKILP
jgi:hypothetical protein